MQKKLLGFQSLRKRKPQWPIIKVKKYLIMKTENPLKESGLIFISVGLFAFLFNFVWESFHSFSLYENHKIDSDQYVLMMGHMSLLDALTILGIYLVIAVFERNIFWVKRMDKKQNYLIFILGLVVAVLAEYQAVYVKQEWSYNKFMPVIYGIGLSPLIQLSITGLASSWLTKRLLYPNEKLK
jgi:magnesium-transporting ATPase (P-type)